METFSKIEREIAFARSGYFITNSDDIVNLVKLKCIEKLGDFLAGGYEKIDNPNKLSLSKVFSIISSQDKIGCKAFDELFVLNGKVYRDLDYEFK